MCGLVGMLGDIDSRQKKAFRGLLDVCQVRGRHSTGVVAVERDDGYDWVKRVGPPSYLFDTTAYDRRIDNNFVVKALLGHCRHKTVGEISNKTAHPFDFPDEGLVGMHNGTLRGYYDLDGYHHSMVDSEVLMGHLAKNGPQDTFNQIEGAWACVWYNQKEKTINFIRNNQRPLWFAWAKNKRQLYWASEKWMFGAIERAPDEAQGIDLWDGGEDGKHKYVELPINTLWSFEVDLTAPAIAPPQGKARPLIKLRTPVKIEPKKVEVRSNPGNHSHGSAASTSTGSKIQGWNGHSNTYGEWSQNPKTGAWEKNKNNGGSVPDPFRSKEGQEKLPLVLTDSRGGSKRSPSQRRKSTTSLPTLTELSTGSKSTKKSARNILSLHRTPTNDGQKTNRSGLCAVSQQQPELLALRTPTSLRVVAGINYITNNNNGKEYSEEQFDKNTGSVCCHCREPIGDLSEVQEIFDDNAFLCKSCVTPSKLNIKVA